MTPRIRTTPDDAMIASTRVANPDLAVKYTGRGPRFTSYPTALQLRADFQADTYYNWLRSDSSRDQAPLSLYVHLPFCHSICYFCACNKVVTRDKSAAATYLGYLKREIALQSQLAGAARPVTQLHWGGGTPTFLDNAELTELMHTLATHFHLLDRGDLEYSIEIDPRTVQRDSIALLKGLGFNRISLGIQDFDPLVQKAVNRIQPYDQVRRLVENIRLHGFRSLSFDLIHGLPHQDCHSMEETLRRVVSLRPDRIACYNYAHLPERFSSQRAIDRLDLPRPREKLLLQQLISERLDDAGYVHIGLDHYVLPQDDLAIAQREGRLQRNFQGYSLRLADDLLGLGVSAISQVGDFMLQNVRELDAYYASLDQDLLPLASGYRLSGEDKLRRHIIMSLICDLHLDIDACNRRFGCDFATRFGSELEALRDMEADGLLQVDSQSIVVNPRGRPFLRNICMLFDAYLDAPGGDRQRPAFSATV